MAVEIASNEGGVLDHSAVEALKKCDTSSSFFGCDADGPTKVYRDSLRPSYGDVPTACPPSTITGGRPPSASMKAWVSSRKKQKTKQGVSSD